MSDVPIPDQKQNQTPVVLAKGTCAIKGWSDAVNTTWFDPQRYELHAHPVADGGRGSAWYVDVAGQPGVLRQYRRGGMIAKLSRDLYWWTGRDQTRSFREFDILAALAERSSQGLNVPRPVAAMACRTHGLFYRAALITQRIAQAEAFWKYDDGLIWERAGQMIARLHRAGVWHADLNVNNILIDPHEKIWLIDFDRARTGVTDPKRLYGNLQRLERSVRKVCSERIHDCWPMLLSGYARAPD